MNDVANELTSVAVLPGQKITASGNGSGIDLQDYEGSVKLMLASSAGESADDTLDIKIQESSDDSVSDAYTDITDATFTQVTNAAASKQDMRLTTRGTKRYIRAVKTVAGSAPVFHSAVLLVGQKKYN